MYFPFFSFRFSLFYPQINALNYTVCIVGCGPQELYSLGPGLDLEFETESSLMVPEPAQYETIYVTSHKAQCRAGAFNADGTLIATGKR